MPLSQLLHSGGRTALTLGAIAVVAVLPASTEAQSPASPVPTYTEPIRPAPPPLGSSSSAADTFPLTWPGLEAAEHLRRQAAEPPSSRRTEVSGTIGWSTFPDEVFLNHVTAAVSVRVPFSRRWSVEPRFIYMRSGAEDQDFYAMASLIYDLETRGPVTPYWTIGGGYFWHRSTFPAFAGFEERTFVGGSSHLSGGFGARIRLAERWSAVSEARLGWDPILQFSAGIGYSF